MIEVDSRKTMTRELLTGLIALLLVGCSATMQPVEERNGTLIYDHMHKEFTWAEASAQKRCAAQGLKSKHVITKCWYVGDRADVLNCFDTVMCEACRSEFVCK
jgi:hypothetical protein